jgi:4a-hydroxytetrahydrobiopterin dehydratase
MERRALSDTEIAEVLNSLKGWELRDGKLHKLFKFPSFAQAIGWMVTVAIYADKLDHHPDWSNVYNRVEVELVTHDLGAVSTWDMELAKKMDALA